MTDDQPAVSLRFEILGPVRAYRGSEQLDLGPPKQQAVLALLLLHAGKPVPLHEIVAALWNGDPPENGIDVVQRYIGALRRALDPERTSLLALTGDGYVLRAGDTALDAALFRAAVARAHNEHQTGNIGTASDEVRHALGLWRDEPLAGLTGMVFESARARLNLERATASKLLAHPRRPAPGPPHPADPLPVKPTPTDPPSAKPDPTPPKPDYSDPVDPWAGHDLFPPDPLSMA